MLICYGKFLGNYLVMLYGGIKLLYIINCIFQMLIINLLLGQSFHRFGFDVLYRLYSGKDWDTTSSTIFPKVSMCDFRIRETGNPKISHRYTVQCVLPINLFNQQIFTFIWFWYVIILLINIFSFFIWIYRLSLKPRLNYIRRRILLFDKPLSNDFTRLESIDSPGEPINSDQIKKIERFVVKYLDVDGAFMLRVISSNVCDFVCSKLIQELWSSYETEKKFNRKYSTDQDENDNSSPDDEVASQHDDMPSIQDKLLEDSLRYNEMNKKILSQKAQNEQSQTIIKNKRRQALFKNLYRLYKPKKNRFASNESTIQNRVIKASTVEPNIILEMKQGDVINRRNRQLDSVTLPAIMVSREYKETEA